MINGPWQFDGTSFNKLDGYKSVKPEEYENWRKQFTADALLGLRYGQSFCNFFSIRDNLLYFTREIDWCDAYIKDKYIER
jgi:hydroxyacyl-ACP dehydratase HTD2-like protein with hotdog domain